MRTYRIISMICIHILFAVTVAAFVAALAFGEYVIAAGCAAAYSVNKALWWADVENGGGFAVRYEVVLYQDDKGKEKKIGAYEITPAELKKTIDTLNADVKRGVYSRYEIAEV